MPLDLTQVFTQARQANAGDTLHFADQAQNQVQVRTATDATITSYEARKADELANRQLKQAFIAALSQHYDAFHVLEIASRIDLLDDATPLSATAVRAADDSAMRLDNAPVDNVPDAVTSLLDPRGTWMADALARHNPGSLDYTGTALREHVDHALAGLRIQCSRPLLERAVDRAVAGFFQALAPQQPPHHTFALLDQPVPYGLLHTRPRAQARSDIPEPQGFAPLATHLAGPPNTAGRPGDYFNAVQFSDDVDFGQRDWHLNRAVLGAFARRDGMPPQMVDALLQRSIGYLHRYAIGESMPQGWQHAAWQSNTGTYYRNIQGATLYEWFRTQLMRDNEMAALPISSRQALQAIERMCGMSSVQQHDLDYDDAQAAEIFDRIVQACTIDAGGFFLDITARLARIPSAHSLDAEGLRAAVAEIADQARDELAAHIDSHMNAVARQRNLSNEDRDELARQLLDTALARVMIGGTAKINGQPVLLVARGNGHQGRALIEDLPNSLLSHSGFTAGPMQIAENWSRLSSVGTISQALSSGQIAADAVDLPQNASALRQFATFDELLDSEPLRALRRVETAHGKTPESERGTPRTGVLAGITLDLLRGIADEVGPRELDDAAQDPVTGPVFQYLYNRVLHHVENAVAARDDAAAFLNHIQLAHEEIATLVAILQPHDPDSLNLHLPPTTAGLQPAYGLANGGMNAFNSILSGVESQVGSRALNTASLSGTYYEESLHVLQGASSYRHASVDGTDIDAVVDSLRSQTGDRPLHLFVAEFHHNISLEKDRYRQEDLAAIIQAMLDADPAIVDERFTVAIDTTIALNDAPEIRELIERLSPAIDSGRLNLVLFRSAQKFDMAGMDNYNAGFVASYNDPRAYRHYREGAELDPPTSTANFQGILHLQKHAQQGLDRYRGAIMDAHRRMLDPQAPEGLPPDMVTAETRGDEMLLVAPNDDDSVVFLDLRSPYALSDPNRTPDSTPVYVGLYDRITRMMQAQGIASANRPSFGFAHANMTLVATGKLRLTLGLEGSDELGRIRDALVATRDASQLARGILHAAGVDDPHHALMRLLGSASADMLFHMATLIPSEHFEALSWEADPRDGLRARVGITDPGSSTAPHHLDPEQVRVYCKLAVALHQAAGAGQPAFGQAARALLALLQTRTPQDSAEWNEVEAVATIVR